MKVSSTKSIVFSALCVVLLIIAAWLTIPAPVPFTMQTFAIALISVVLGAKRSVFVVSTYIILGIIGLPVFSGFQSGAAIIFGPTGGYTIGFIFFASITGFFSSKFKENMPLTILAMIAGLFVCYAFGTAWYILIFLKDIGKSGAALSVCVLPFIIPDLIKIFLAASCAKKLKGFMYSIKY